MSAYHIDLLSDTARAAVQLTGWSINWLCVTGSMKTDPNHTFGISRINNLKYLIHCESLVLGYSHAKFIV